MERLTKRITENQIELSAKANPTQYINSPQRVHMKHPFWNAFNRLCEYEQLEEQGLLLKLPCKVGDVVYFVDRRYDREKRTFVSFVHNGYVKAIKFSSRPTKVTIEYEDIDDNCGRCKGKDVHASNIGKTVFLTKEEAEAKLKELENESK